jgi:ABC-2 type transport system ATP-binding protein
VEPVVQLNGLSRAFGDLTAVQDLTFEVGRGELFGIVGPDGAGKTTTLRMLAGILRPTSGDATVSGVSVLRNPEGVKPHLAYMSQRFGLYADLTVRENIDFYADLYRVPKVARPSRLERLYAFSALGPFERRLAGQLSGGMKQKLALCCALIHHPAVMLLDEPTFGVDPISRRDLWLIVHEMVEEGVTVIASTAYLDEAERCDRVALFHRGRVFAIDTPANLRTRLHGQVYVVRTTDARRARDLVHSLASVPNVVLFGDTLHLTLADWARDWPTVRAALERARIPILDHGPADPSLEDVFIDVVRSASTDD